MCGLAVACALFASSATTRATTDPEPDPEPPAGPLATAGAIVPGVLLHGSGHFVAGRKQAALRLLTLEAAGLGLVLGGGSVIVLTGASRDLVGPAAALTIAGVGLFTVSFLADVYGVVVPLDARGKPLSNTPFLESELGFRYVYDPVFEYRSFLVEGLDARFDRWRLAPSAWFALNDQNARLRLLGAYRFYGARPTPAPAATDGSYVDGEVALTQHRFTSDGFRTWTIEGFVNTRLDFARLDPTLRGMFGELGVGYAQQRIDWNLPGVDVDPEWTEYLLARFGFGVFLGTPARRGGEAMLYYDHRHDDFAAGLKMTGLGSGVAGHFGAMLRYYVDENWGVLLDGQVGSAFVGGLSVLYRQPRMP